MKLYQCKYKYVNSFTVFLNKLFFLNGNTICGLKSIKITRVLSTHTFPTANCIFGFNHLNKKDGVVYGFFKL